MKKTNPCIHFITHMPVPENFTGQLDVLNQLIWQVNDLNSSSNHCVNYQSKIIFLMNSNQLSLNSLDSLDSLNFLSETMWLHDIFLPNQIIKNLSDIQKILQNQYHLPNHILPILLMNIDLFLQLSLTEQRFFQSIYILDPANLKLKNIGNIDNLDDIDELRDLGDLEIIKKLIDRLMTTPSTSPSASLSPLNIYQLVCKNPQSIEAGRLLYRYFKQQGYDLKHITNKPNLKS